MKNKKIVIKNRRKKMYCLRIDNKKGSKLVKN
jgi:hypothetical protein